MNLIEVILPYAFSDSVRWFRRSQAICMLISFYQNTRLLEQLTNDNQLDKIEANLSDFVTNVILIHFKNYILSFC